MTVKAFALSCIIGVTSIFGSVEVQAQSNSVNSARIEVLERKIRALQVRLGETPDGVAPTQAGGNRVIADISARMGTLEEQIRRLTGRMEEFEYRQRQLSQTLELVQQEMALQRADIAKAAVQQPVGASNALPSASTEEAPAGATPEVAAVTEPAVVIELPDGDAAAQYDYAFNFIRKNDLDSGQIAMEKFMEVNAGNPLVGNAKFWLGRIYLQQGKNANAAQNFLALIEEHPNHNKRAEALVDLADVLIKLDSASDACNALLEFRRVEDKASGRLKTRASRLAERARCN
ncbi:tetratricopeptide repeat protein [Kordiimonas laminariae]|uniref:tetratricopeptide repeat protein n=1 Tax=Kordiimonas laminariae TaxID=2917717 RepID=UPI001FF6D60D|nr:tetratricopeptide repeat protein [Kordiimonas laminariae]MCK0068623.1 hypothetical protein [Kordiimonas laminariae]